MTTCCWRGAVDATLLGELNSLVDAFPRDMEQGGRYRGAQRRDYTEATGFELHHVVEVGEPFERLIDHASWRAYLRHHCGEQGTYVQGVFRCAQVNLLIALTDITTENGATMVIPGSHKSNMEHPLARGYESYARGDRMDALPGAVPVEMKAGDVVLFTDSLMHGGGTRTRDDGERRLLIYRYGVSWGRTRYGYQYSDELLARVTARQRRVLQPQPPITPGESRVPEDVVFHTD